MCPQREYRAQLLTIFCAIFIISSPDNSSRRFLEVEFRPNCFKIFCKVLRLYEKTLLTVEINTFDIIFFCSKRITTDIINCEISMFF